MKYTLLYFTFLLTSIIPSKLLAQQHDIQNIAWRIVAKIPPAQSATKAIGLAGAITGTYQHLLFIAGGTNFPDKMPWEGGKKKYYNDIFLYQKRADQLLLVPTATKLPFNLAYSAVCSTTDGIVVAGGEDENGLSKKVMLFRLKNDQLLFDYLPDLPNAVTNCALTKVGDVLYLAGGETETGASNKFLSLSLKQKEQGWKKLVNLPMPVSHTVLLSAGNEIFLIGGRKANQGDTSTIYKNVSIFNVQEQVWGAKAALPYPLSAACGMAQNENLLLFSGDTGETFHQVEKLIAAIAVEKDQAKKEKLNQAKAIIQAAHPGFSPKVLKYNVARNTWVPVKGLMPYGSVTTQAVWFENEIIIAGGEVKAGVRTPEIISGKLK